MNTQALKCIPFVILAILGTFYVGMGPAKNMFVLMIQLLCWVVLLTHVPFLLFVAAYRFVRWQFALSERHRANAAILRNGKPSIWASVRFRYSAGLYVFSIAVMALGFWAKAGLKSWIIAQGAEKLLYLQIWSVFNWIQIAGLGGIMLGSILLSFHIDDMWDEWIARKPKQPSPLRHLGDDDDH